MNESEYTAAFEQIVTDPALTDMQKLTRAFHLTTRQYIGHYRHDAEIARAMGDKDTAVREEMKAGMIEAARGMFGHCYLRITGKRGNWWDE
ncbi:MAG: hypothetical protein KF770_16705 [Anaerolineae bacterium]|nr:hypothetical protein [Anaerolineae bacterium]